MGYARETELLYGCRTKCSVQAVEVAVPFLLRMPDGWMLACVSRHWCRRRQKLPIFFRPRCSWTWCWDETASPMSYIVGHVADYKRKPWNIKTPFLHYTNKGSEESCQFSIPISKKIIGCCFRNGKEHRNSIESDKKNAQHVMFWPQRHHLPKQGGHLLQATLCLSSFDLVKAHRANENALRTGMVLLLHRSTSDTFASSNRRRRSLATWLWQLYVFWLKMYGSVKWFVDLPKRSLVALYVKNSKPVRSRGLELYLA